MAFPDNVTARQIEAIWHPITSPEPPLNMPMVSDIVALTVIADAAAQFAAVVRANPYSFDSTEIAPWEKLLDGAEGDAMQHRAALAEARQKLEDAL